MLGPEQIRMWVLQGTTGILVCRDNESLGPHNSPPGCAPVSHRLPPVQAHTAWPLTTIFRVHRASLESINISPLQPETKIVFPKVDSNQIRLVFKTVCGTGKQSHFLFPAGRKGHSTTHSSRAISCYLWVLCQMQTESSYSLRYTEHLLCYFLLAASFSQCSWEISQKLPTRQGTKAAGRLHGTFCLTHVNILKIIQNMSY